MRTATPSGLIAMKLVEVSCAALHRKKCGTYVCSLELMMARENCCRICGQSNGMIDCGALLDLGSDALYPQIQWWGLNKPYWGRRGGKVVCSSAPKAIAPPFNWLHSDSGRCVCYTKRPLSAIPDALVASL